MLKQTALRGLVLLIVVSLPCLCPTSVAAQKVASRTAALKFKPHYLGIASWYGQQHQGRKMANGKKFDRNKLTAASWYFPLGTVARVVNLESGKSVVVTITDRGPALRLNRLIDLSEAAARELGYVHQGLTPVLMVPLVQMETLGAKLDGRLMAPLTFVASASAETSDGER